VPCNCSRVLDQIAGLIFMPDVWQACCSKEPKHLTLINSASPSLA
jgi:hypothetical protein